VQANSSDDLRSGRLTSLWSLDANPCAGVPGLALAAQMLLMLATNAWRAPTPASLAALVQASLPIAAKLSTA